MAGGHEATTIIPDTQSGDGKGDLEGPAGPGSLEDYVSGLPDDFTLNQKKYDFTSRVFPMDLGEQSYNGHYMVININVQNGTRFDKRITNQDGKAINTFTQDAGELSKVDSLKAKIDAKWKDSSGESFNTIGYLPRNTRRIVESIALYMPNTVVFDTNNDYEDVGLTSIGTSAGSRLLQTATGFIPGKTGKIVGNALGAIGAGSGRAAQLVQRPINQRVEVLFRNTTQRTFQFDFLFAPEHQKESYAMHQIIKTLRFHAAPEYVNNTSAFMYVPPSEFDITFYNRGIENMAIPRINTCALSKINVDYAPQGIWSTFGNGHPVSCRMQMEFRELEVVSKLRVLQGF